MAKLGILYWISVMRQYFYCNKCIFAAMKETTINTTELLLPSGSVETFYAAAEGGADAVYLGMKSYSARGRANNFSFSQLAAIRMETRKRGMKMYITLNTVIKNTELSDLFYSLSVLQKLQVDAVIIQDWGVYRVVKKYFPSLKIHASTQMGNHNSLGLKLSDKLGFERVILARELTQAELNEMLQKSDIQAEVFVHGALCYSFSGMCLFSSYIGGSGANRGWCKQPCRRTFQKADGAHFIFSLKDNELIDYVPQLKEAGVASIKIEGRLKSAEYVYKVAKAYRMVLDDPQTLPQARELLRFDFGREKTSYFFGGKVTNSITDAPNTGLFLGKVQRPTENGLHFELSSKIELKEGYLLRIRDSKDGAQNNVKIRKIDKVEGPYQIEVNKDGAASGDQVFLAGMRTDNFPSRFPELPNINIPSRIQQKYDRAKREFRLKRPAATAQFLLRIDSADWLRKIRVDDYSAIFLKMTRTEWEKLPLKSPFFAKNMYRFYIELPKFIPEKDIPFYQELCLGFFKNGIKNFVLSHLSQKELLPQGAIVHTNENVYVFNDATVDQLLDQKVESYVYPLENEWENLFAGRDRGGIVPVFFYPELFYSRMPVDIPANNPEITDNDGLHYQKFVRDGVTITVPSVPVSYSLYAAKIQKAGFRRFLFDLSYMRPSKNFPQTLLKRWKSGEQVQPSVTFNFKKGLK